MNFLAANGDAPLLEQQGVPSHLASYQVASVQARYIQWRAGELLTQAALGNGVVCWWLRFIVTQAFSVLPLCYEPAWLFTYNLDRKTYSVTFAKQGPLPVWHLTAGQHQFLCVYCYGELDFPEHQQLPMTKEMEQMIRNLLHPEQISRYQSLTVTGRVNDLMRLYLQQAAELHQFPTLSYHQQQIITKAENYILCHLDEPLPLDRICEACGISRSYLQRICKAGRGKGLHAIVTELRLKEAARLLRTTNEQVGAIAVKISDWNLASFCTAFQQHYQQTPLQYRRASRQKQK